MSKRDWNIKINEKNNIVTVHLEVELQEYKINQPFATPIKITTSQVVRYLQKQGIQTGRALKTDTVTNRSEQNKHGTWIFELISAPSESKPKPKQRKRATTRKKKAPPSPPSEVTTDD